MDVGDGRFVRVMAAEDLLVHKALAGRPRDAEDIRGILLRRRGKLDTDLARRWLKLLCELLESEEPLRLFEDLVEETG